MSSFTDNMNWGCLDYTMSRFGFGNVSRNWIRWCLSNARFSMAINGTASNMFISTKGLKQGDPMYPFLFILIVEVLSVMIKRAASLNLISGFKPSSEAFEINHLQFANDLIVFLDDNTEQVNNLKNILLDFELVSGISLGSKSKAVGVWDVILQNFQKKLSMWQKKYLSKGVYYLSLFQIPVSVEKQMEKIMRQLLWGSINNKRKKGWVGWKKVNLPKEGGGTGIKKLRLMNKSLHAKWIWRYGNEEKALWRKIMRLKFGGHEKSFLPKKSYKQVNSGDKVLFWKDVWLNEQLFQVMFPSLFSLSRLQDATIHEVLDVNAGNNWNFEFCRNLREAEIEDIAHLMNLLSTFHRGEGQDHRIWQNGTKYFSAAECYKSLEDDGLLVFPYKSVSVRDILWEWRIKKGRNLSLKTMAWDIIPFAIWWAVWLERNSRASNGRYNSMEI
ncbi:uncharacterized protein LOC113272606 [Papaver somniferum]|uniref:uncharacterized protein LOC113272606 n=1 Tax=Papaver somniferum TaxID=3469 RepID=UPI000E6F5A2A|nr:uncharacterized protein LOC113272606 [Papaver somniferum]